MKSLLRFPFLSLIACGCLSLLTGCHNESESASTADSMATVIDSIRPEFAAVKTVVWSDSKLEGDSLTPTEVKEAQSPEDAANAGTLPVTAQEVLLAGRIEAGDLPPFSPTESAFILSQLPEAGHEDDPDHVDNCPFCKRKLENAPKAIVQIKDDEGKLLPISVDVLLGLKKGDAVLVKGRARYDEALQTIYVHAEQISRR